MRRIERLIALASTVSSLLDLYQLMANLRTADLIIRLSERCCGDGKGGGDCNSIEERFHDFFPRLSLTKVAK
ncbi:hypothetical protein BG57_28590 [Caballeronia grimmiae]|uniref:Uncharacterized protein n=1 Tax=Caballeronia grimmiae TaxID=1071679 RepID=A0A069NC27_9BURK|nr:hypothetical protein BG57_28590 [Caballeronia grimmiae]